MRMIEIDFEARPPIDAYGGGGFRIAGEKRLGSLLHLPSGLAQWPVADAAELSEQAFATVLAQADDIDVVLVGMGPDIAPLPRPAREAFEALNLGVETMSTAAACRTFNVLLAEDRRVAAALIAV